MEAASLHYKKRRSCFALLPLFAKINQAPVCPFPTASDLWVHCGPMPRLSQQLDPGGAGRLAAHVLPVWSQLSATSTDAPLRWAPSSRSAPTPCTSASSRQTCSSAPVTSVAVLSRPPFLRLVGYALHVYTTSRNAAAAHRRCSHTAHARNSHSLRRGGATLQDTVALPNPLDSCWASSHSSPRGADGTLINYLQQDKTCTLRAGIGNCGIAEEAGFIGSS